MWIEDEFGRAYEMLRDYWGMEGNAVASLLADVSRRYSFLVFKAATEQIFLRQETPRRPGPAAISQACALEALNQMATSGRNDGGEAKVTWGQYCELVARGGVRDRSGRPMTLERLRAFTSYRARSANEDAEDPPDFENLPSPSPLRPQIRENPPRHEPGNPSTENREKTASRALPAWLSEAAKL